MTVLEGIFIHIAPIRDAHFGEAGATTECPFSNLRYRWWDGDTSEAGATRESRIIIRPSLYLCHRWWDGDACETGAIRECPVPNLRHR